LTERENANTGLTQVVHGLKKLGLRLAETEHDATLGHQSGTEFAGTGEKIERELILRTGTHKRGEALDGFEIVVENIGPRLKNTLEWFVFAVEIRHKNFDDDFRIQRADGLDGFAKMIGTTVGKVITRNSGDHDMLEAEAFHPLRDALRLIFFEGERLGGIDGAKSTSPRATITCDHKSSSSPAPALPAIRALRAFANRVEAKIRNQTLGGKEDRIRGQAHLDPVGLLLLMKGRVDFNGGHGFPEKCFPSASQQQGNEIPSILYFTAALSTINALKPDFL
jgi:hypothetical protein